MKTKLKILIIAASTTCCVYLMSEWWEKGLAIPLASPTISPNGCYRVERFKPFWVLPDMFHREPDPNGDVEPYWFPSWEYPGFYRLYDNRTGALLGESEIYDLAYASGRLTWGLGSGRVYAGMINLGPNVPDCIGDQPGRRNDR